MSSCFDVAIVGGGPAGLSAAIALRAFGHSVVFLDRSRTGARVGETLAPEVRDLLASICSLDGFEDIPSVSFVGSRSSWGSTELYERSSILNPLGAGLHVDRSAFDEWFRLQAISSGAVIQIVDDRLEMSESPEGWYLDGSSVDIASRFLVDARGRSSVVNVPRKWIAFDRMVGLVGWLSGDGAPECELLIEPVEQGWWYSAPQPGGGLVATFMTDADLLASSSGELSESWSSALREASMTMERLSRFSLKGELEVRRAESGYSYPDRGTRWRAIGDAALACDPLAGVGIANAIRAGIDAAAEISSALKCGFDRTDPTPPPLAYLEDRARYYAMETRWPSSIFWMRRHPVSLDNFQVFLDPGASLFANQDNSEQMLARAEALLPPRAIRDLLARLKTPKPAHETLALLRELSGPLGDQRLLAGLQLLVIGGALIET